jgi:hypothetical protein
MILDRSEGGRFERLAVTPAQVDGLGCQHARRRRQTIEAITSLADKRGVDVIPPTVAKPDEWKSDAKRPKSNGSGGGCT